MERTLWVWEGVAPDGMKSRIVIPSDKQIYRSRFQAERARERAEELKKASEAVQEKIPGQQQAGEIYEVQRLQAELEALEARRGTEWGRAALHDGIAEEMQHAQDTAQATGDLQQCRYTLPELGWTSSQEAEARELARSWDGPTPRHDERIFRDHLLRLCVKTLGFPDGEGQPIVDLPVPFRDAIFEDLRDLSQPSYENVAFFTWWSNAISTKG